VAVLVGAIEALGLVGDKFGLDGGVWVTADAIGARFAALGYIVVVMFVATWLISFVIYRAMRYPKIPTFDNS
jgi:high-affinity nickel-transport protein